MKLYNPFRQAEPDEITEMRAQAKRHFKVLWFVIKSAAIVFSLMVANEMGCLSAGCDRQYVAADNLSFTNGR